MLQSRTKPAFRVMAILFTVLLFSGLGYRLLVLSEKVTPTSLGWDASQSLCMAFNLYHHGVLSLDGHMGTRPRQDATAPPRPTAYREPMLPIFMSLVLFLDEDLRSASYDELERGARFSPKGPDREAAARRYYPYLVYQQALFFFGTLLCAFVATYLMSRSLIAGWIVTFLLATSPGVADYNLRVLSEGPATLLLLLLSTLFFLAECRKHWGYYVAAGAALGLLTLTRATFYYFLLPICCLAAIRLLVDRRRLEPWRYARLCFMMVFSSLLLVGPWMIRNYIHFGTATLTGRGGQILAGRANFNTMTGEEFRQALIIWFPGMAAYDGLIPTTDAYRIIGLESKTSRFDRMNPKWFMRAGIFKTSENFRAIVRRHDGSTFAAEKEVGSYGLRRILRAPLKHLVTSALFFYRGLSVERIRPQILDSRLRSWKSKGAITLSENIVLVGSMLLLLMLGIRRREFLLFCLPGVFLLSFNSLLTHNIVRYVMPLLPIYYVSFGVLVVEFSRHARRKLHASRTRQIVEPDHSTVVEYRRARQEPVAHSNGILARRGWAEEFCRRWRLSGRSLDPNRVQEHR